MLYSMTVHTGVVDTRTTVPQIRPEILPLIGSAIILGRDIQLLDKIGQGTYKRTIALKSAIYVVSENRRCRTHFVCVMPCMFGNMKLLQYVHLSIVVCLCSHTNDSIDCQKLMQICNL